jgi:hypothetical protein
MAGKFTKDNQPDGRGRPKGVRNKRSYLDQEITQAAIEQLKAAVQAGEPYAISLVLDRLMPKLKPVTDENSLDGELLRARIFEITELEDRIKAIEEGLANNGK